MEFNVDNYLSNLSYINKDFGAVWDEILTTVPKLTNKWLPSEANESDPLVTLLKELAIVTDKLNYNIDKNILELFPATLTQTRSAYNVYESLGYIPSWYVSATTDLTINYNGLVKREGESQSFESATEYKIGIPRFTQFCDSTKNIIYTTIEDLSFHAGKIDKKSVLAMEGTFNDLEINGSKLITLVNLDNRNRLYFPQYNIAENSIYISSNSDFNDIFNDDIPLKDSETDKYLIWTKVDNLNQYISGNKIYKLGIDNLNNSIYLEFPEDIGTLIGDGIYVRYALSSGSQGNISAGDISEFFDTSFEYKFTNDEGIEYLVDKSNFAIINTKSTLSGKDPLNIEEMRNQFNKVVGVFNTLITLRDYESYIYNYIDNQNKHLVSNIRVSDRTNDLWGSVDYITYDIYKGYYSRKVPIDNSDITAYSLRLYPLAPINSINTKNDFNITFNKDINDGGNSRNQLNDNIEEILENENKVKCINHDFLTPGDPILIPYDLKGQIYLKNRVSETEATNILKKVELEIYNTLNSRELEWGKEVDYSKLIERITKADDRIQYVGLDAIEYDNYEPPKNIKYDVIIRNILKGNSPWTSYRDFNFQYNQTEGSTTSGTDWQPNTSGSGVTTNSGPITRIETLIGVDTTEGNSYLTNENESFTILVPQYNTVKTYSNYLYYIAKSNSETENETLLANNASIVPAGCFIYIFDNRDNALDFTANRGNSYKYIINPGTIIKPTIDIEFKDTLTEGISPEGSVVNMGSNIQINILEKATGTLKPNSNYSDTRLYIATNSRNLRNAFSGEDNLIEDTDGNNIPTPHPYTLLANEYLFYTDANGAELGIVGEGTTLTPLPELESGTFSKIENLTLIESSISSSLIGGELDNSYLNWSYLSTSDENNKNNNKEIGYRINELITLGGNYIISAYDEENKLINLIPSGFETNSFKELNGVYKLKYCPITRDSKGVISIDSNNWVEVQSLNTEVDKYQILLRLSLISGPNYPQTLLSSVSEAIGEDLQTYKTTQKVNLIKDIFTTVSIDERNYQPFTYYIYNSTTKDYYLSTSKNYIKDTQYWSRLENPTPIQIEGKTFQTSYYLTYNGGVALNMYDKDKIISFYSYNVNEDISSRINTQGFIDISKLNSDIPLIVPSGGEEDYAVIPYLIPGQVCPRYMLVKSGSTITIGKEIYGGSPGFKIGNSNAVNASQLGSPYITEGDSEIYRQNSDGSSTKLNLSTLTKTYIIDLSNVSNINYLYIEQKVGENIITYSPITPIEESNLIEDPTTPTSYFMSQHPCNRYVLPWLNDLGKLGISSNSISK